MADEDEVDVLGDFTFDNLFPKEDSRISACYDGGVHGTDQLLHDCINPAWLLEPSQPCWFSPTHDDRQRTSPASADDRSALGFTNLGSAGSPSHWEEQTSDTAWSEREKSLLDKGIELFGRSWSRVAQFVGSKSPQAVRTQARLMGLAGVSSVSESSEVQEEEEVVTTSEVNDIRQPVSFTFSELIDDMAIPASIEEVIAVVTTAQPTVQGGSALSPPIKRQRQLSFSENTKVRTVSNAHARVGVQNSRVRNGGEKGGKRGRPKKPQSGDNNHTITNHDEVNTLIVKDPVPIRVVSEGEQLVRIQKETEESEESEIDIDDTDDLNSEESKLVICETPIKIEVEEDKVLEAFKEPEQVVVKSEPNEKVFDLPHPKREITLDPDVISEEEKEIHFEFFLGRSAKTPSRYLKIRNHIVDCWDNCRPSYVSKTSVRSGLKNCGDVNCIGRVHAYLEMVGAINFGCEQTQYRPIIIGGKSGGGGGSSAVKIDTKPNLTLAHRAENARPRKKKPEYLDSDGEGGYTISHDGSGGVVYTKEPRREKKSAHEQLRLVYCHRFSEFTPAPYSVVLDVGALLLMDVHAHACSSEVIGLLGGSFDSDAKVLHISRGVACRSQSTGVQCDMCPVSQTEASEKLQDAGLEVVGWYHSHPTFLPNPSLQDLDTQLKVQTWFDKTDAPFVGIIVSPYFHGNKTMASNFKCLIVREEGEVRKPYQFPLRISASQTCSDSLVTRIADIFQHLGHGQGSEVVPFNEETVSNPPITYLQKLVESVKIHMERCQPVISPEERANLIAGIMDICLQNCPTS